MPAAKISSTVFESVSERLADGGASQAVADLWDEISRAFQESGPEAVKAIIEGRVRALTRAAQRDLKATRDVAGSVGPNRRKTASPRPSRPARGSRSR
jgi:hypothetical protein